MNFFEIILNSFQLIYSLDAALYNIIFLSLRVSLKALLLSSILALILGYILAVKDIFFKIDGGHIASKILYLENEGELIFMSKNSLEIKNKKKFAKKLQIKVDKIKDIRKINFNLLRNIDTGKISISEIKIDDLNNNKSFNQIYNVNNIQELRSLLKTILNS